MRILVLDDDYARHDLFSLIFRGEDITKAFDAWEAQEAIVLAREPFDIATLDHDLGMNAGNGVQVARFIAALKPEKRPLRVFVHSANPVGAQTMVDILRRAGVDVMRVDPLEMARNVRTQA